MKRKNWKSWLLLAVPYLLTAMIPVISVLFLGNTILSNYEERLLEEKQSSLQVAADRMQQKFDTIERMAAMMGSGDVLSRYSYACLNQAGHSPLDFVEVKEFLSTATFDPIIHDIFICDNKDDAAISANSALNSMEVFFRYYYIVSGLSAQENIRRLDSLPHTQHYFPSVTLSIPAVSDTTKQIVEYRMFLPIGWVRDMQCQLVVAMDADALFEDFRDAVTGDGEFYVYDSTDTLIYSSGSQYGGLLDLDDGSTLRPIPREEAPLYGAVLRSGDWQVKVFVPEPTAGSNALSFLSPSFILFVILPMLLCMLLALFFSNNNYRGVQDLLGLFHGHTGEPPREPEIMDYRLVRRYVSQVIAEKNLMTQRITQYSDSRKYEVLDKLVRNTYNSREEAAKALAEADLTLREGRNIVVCIHCSEISFDAVIVDGVTVRDTVRQVIGALLEQPYVLFDTATNETTCIISLEEEEIPDLLIQGIISQLTVELTYRCGIEVNIGVGNAAPSAYSLHESYAQAHQVLQYTEAYGSKINLYSELLRLEDSYFYPREYSEKISNYIIAGKQEDAQQLIRQVYEENFEKPQRPLSRKATGKLQQQLWECAASLGEKYSVSTEGLLPPESESKSFFAALFRCVEELSSEIQNKQKLVWHKTAGKILAYVEENFRDRNLSLKQISETFGIHESYASNVFKNAVGENMSVYIERLRIQKAQELLKNTDWMIQQIAEAVGYTSDTSFRRAFKKLTGMSPGEYREH